MHDEANELDAHDDAQTDQQFPWHMGVYDAHCHPTDIMSSIADIPNMKARVLTVMATRNQDQDLVMQINDKLGISSAEVSTLHAPRTCQILPAFGWHPWFSHQLFDDRSDPTAAPPAKLAHYKAVMVPPVNDEKFVTGLPDPMPLSEYLDQTRAALIKCPLALIGEIGLDKSFRVPEIVDEQSAICEPEPGKTLGSRDGRRLSPYHVDVAHQQAILKAQLSLAGEMHRPVSVHGVAAHGLLFQTIQSTWSGHEKVTQNRRQRKLKDADPTEEDNGKSATGQERKTCRFPPRICLHSYSGSVEQSKQYLKPSVPTTVFFSFSKAINFSTPASTRATEVIKALPSDRILVESDLHRAGEQMDRMLEEITRMICHFRGWSLEEGVRRLATNWKHFAFGSV